MFVCFVRVDTMDLDLERKEGFPANATVFCCHPTKLSFTQFHGEAGYARWGRANFLVQPIAKLRHG